MNVIVVIIMRGERSSYNRNSMINLGRETQQRITIYCLNALRFDANFGKSIPSFESSNHLSQVCPLFNPLTPFRVIFQVCFSNLAQQQW